MKSIIAVMPFHRGAKPQSSQSPSSALGGSSSMGSPIAWWTWDVSGRNPRSPGPPPPANDFTQFEWKGEEITSGLRALQEGLDAFRPNLCLLLGVTALRAAKGYSEPITNWRGSLFIGGENTAFAGRKCLATYHPASALRVYEQTPLLLFDLKRARTEGESPDLVLPERQITVAETTEDPRANTLSGTARVVERCTIRAECQALASSVQQPETIIEIPPYRGGWQCFEAPGVQPYWNGENAKQSAVDYAKGRAKFGRGEIRVLKLDGSLENVIRFSEPHVHG